MFAAKAIWWRRVEFARAAGLPVFVLGGGSNLLVADAGFDGMVLRMEIAR